MNVLKCCALAVSAMTTRPRARAQRRSANCCSLGSAAQPLAWPATLTRRSLGRRFRPDRARIAKPPPAPPRPDKCPAPRRQFPRSRRSRRRAVVKPIVAAPPPTKHRDIRGLPTPQVTSRDRSRPRLSFVEAPYVMGKGFSYGRFRFVKSNRARKRKRLRSPIPRSTVR